MDANREEVREADGATAEEGSARGAKGRLGYGKGPLIHSWSIRERRRLGEVAATGANRGSETV
jgi:hypothetical protein